MYVRYRWSVERRPRDDLPNGGRQTLTAKCGPGTYLNGQFNVCIKIKFNEAKMLGQKYHIMRIPIITFNLKR